MNVKCQVTRCQRSHDNYRHSMTGELYCKSCAMKINRANNLPNLIVKQNESNSPEKHIRE